MSEKRTFVVLAALAFAVVTACGDDDAASDTTAAGSPAAPEITTQADTAIGTVLVDAAGMTLYTAERESRRHRAMRRRLPRVLAPGDRRLRQPGRQR